MSGEGKEDSESLARDRRMRATSLSCTVLYLYVPPALHLQKYVSSGPLWRKVLRGSAVYHRGIDLFFFFITDIFFHSWKNSPGLIS